jgi:sugar lactone lactonase YvrE
MMALLLVVSVALGQNCFNREPATVVYGQLGSFMSNAGNNNVGVSANSLFNPQGLASDGFGNVYIADLFNNRVLVYAPGSTTAFRVYGQMGSFTSGTFLGTSNNGGISANSLSSPFGVAVDSANNVYIADQSNQRVLVYAPGSTTAFRVYGQLGNFTSSTANNGGISANSLSFPIGVAVDSASNVYVADNNNNRVLVYASGSTTAFRVFGQLGSFTSGAANNGGISANSLSSPRGLAFDIASNVYIGDESNHRVLVYVPGSTTAFRVFGQLGSFTSGAANNGGISANSLQFPEVVVVDSASNVYIADHNNRVLVYASGSTTAFRVFGQLGSFTTGTPDLGGVSANSLSSPFGVAVDSTGILYIADSANNRVLESPCYCVANFISTTGFGPCFACPAGAGAAFGSINCSTCGSGFFSPSPGQPCQSCTPGFYSNKLTGSIGCTPCPAGTYLPSAGALLSSCIPCPDGTASGAIGASSSLTCQPCPAGASVGIGGTSCVSNSNSTGGGLPLGGIIGVSIGAVLIAAVVAIVGGLFIYRRVTARHDDYTEMMTDEKGDGVFYKM